MADLLSNALNAIKVAESKGKLTCTVPGSKLVREVLRVMKENDYLNDFEEVPTRGKGIAFKIALKGKINACGPIRPQYFVKLTDWEQSELDYLPGNNLGIIIATTSKGVLTHNAAKEQQQGGKLLAYVY